MRYRYEEHTWPELRELARENRVVVVPVATLEDHGYHLPVDTDVRIVSAICDEACRRSAGRTLLFPTAVHGYTPHHMGFPGTITLRWNVLVEYLLDIGRSLARHGFRKQLYVNGHGSNIPLVDVAARLVNMECPDALAASCFYLQSEESLALLGQIRDSPFPGGVAHACELETSLYLALAPDLVQQENAVREIPAFGRHSWIDWTAGPLSLWEDWSATTESGVFGDPTLASADKGRALLERAVEEILAFVDELCERERRAAPDHHAT